MTAFAEASHRGHYKEEQETEEGKGEEQEEDSQILLLTAWPETLHLEAVHERRVSGWGIFSTQ